MDTESGLYNYDARLYDPVIGRFVTPDTIVPEPFNPQDLNRYSYVRNNPLKYTDPTGHSIPDSVKDASVALDEQLAQSNKKAMDSLRGKGEEDDDDSDNSQLSTTNWDTVYDAICPITEEDQTLLAGWQFHRYDHGGPHFQDGTQRYDAKTLEPLRHKGKKPPELSKKKKKDLMKTKAWQKAVRQGITNPNKFSIQPMFMFPGQMQMMEDLMEGYKPGVQRDELGRPIA